MAIYTIPAGNNFLEKLAGQLLKEYGDNPLDLSDVMIFLPTRRSCRVLKESFLKLSLGKPLLLPRMRPLGDIDNEETFLYAEERTDLSQAISPLQRHLLLARQIIFLGNKRGGEIPTPDQAYRLAVDLASLLDQVQLEELSFEELKNIVPDNLAYHWQITLQFLEILTEFWPSILREKNLMDPIVRRHLLIDAQSEEWKKNPPSHPVIAAGSTGSIPAIARFLTVIANLPQGRLILPGLDRHYQTTNPDKLEQTHPQFGLHRLLERLHTSPKEVALWPECEETQRSWLAHYAFAPARESNEWLKLSKKTDDPIPPNCLSGVTRLDCQNSSEEAKVIVLLLRQTLEDPHKTAALITPDRSLARRVVAEMRRYGVEINDSAGLPLSATSVGAFLSLTAEMMVKKLAPHSLLAVLKHHFSFAHYSSDNAQKMVRYLERYLLRAPRPEEGALGLRQAANKLNNPPQDFIQWLENICKIIEPYESHFKDESYSLSVIVEKHIALVEALSTDETGNSSLWMSEGGEVAFDFMRSIVDLEDSLDCLKGRDYPSLLKTMMDLIPIRPHRGLHPRLSILGPLEGRLIDSDLLILSGLNEGTWPPDVKADPWMSRPMRASFGLPSPERRIGLSAHDFVQAFCSKNVVITRSEKKEGTPTVPSRWLRRLETVLNASGQSEVVWTQETWLHWARMIDSPKQGAHYCDPPTPKPPLEARPRELSVTWIEKWMRDPYGLYAAKILKLKKLKSIDSVLTIADYGNLIHDALFSFIQLYPSGPLPTDAFEKLLEIGKSVFHPYNNQVGLMTFWWPRFETMGRWFIITEKARRSKIKQSYVEIEGGLFFNGSINPFLVTARADRIDLLTDDTLCLIDYKTGQTPTNKEIEAGYAPQLPLEIVIAASGGFDNLDSKKISKAEFWKLSGNNKGSKIFKLSSNLETLIFSSVEGLEKLIAKFDDPSTPYEVQPHPDYAPRYNDYSHLERIKEWSVQGNEDDYDRS